MMDIGGKAEGLRRMQALGIQVPKFEVLSTSNSTTATNEFLTRVLGNIGTGPYAVRSSANVEDGKFASFAGIFETRLGVSYADLPSAIESVQRSTDTERARQYIETLGPKISRKIEMAVIVQQLVDPDFSGVALSYAPRTCKKALLVEAIRGIGELLVSGEIEPDLYLVNRSDFRITDRRKGDQRYMQTIDGLRRLSSSEIATGAFHLRDKEILEVAKVVKILEDATNGPIDMEFCFEDGSFLGLQARPLVDISERKAAT